MWWGLLGLRGVAGGLVLSVELRLGAVYYNPYSVQPLHCHRAISHAECPAMRDDDVTEMSCLPTLGGI